MKTLKVSDQTHAELTRVAGQLTAESGKLKTYEETIIALLHRSVFLPPELVAEVEAFLENNRELGYVTREEFLKDAVRSLIEQLNKKQKVPPQ